MVLNKHEIESALRDEHRDIQSGKIKEDNPLDLSESFRKFCEACRRGDLRVCQELLMAGVNINARDSYDYTPLILASLCGHYEVVQLLLESGALCDRDTFFGERCLYNALNDRIRNLLLSYDYSKSTDPLQPFAAHITALLTKDHPNTSDILLHAGNDEFHLHKFILAARSPYFRKKLAAAPDTTAWRLPNTIHAEALQSAIKFMYLAEVGADFKDERKEKEILEGIDKLSRHLEMEQLFEDILINDNRRLARQRRQDEVARGRNQMENWFRENVLKHKIQIDTAKAGKVKWDRHNAIFADVLLQADEVEEELEASNVSNNLHDHRQPESSHSKLGIPIGPKSASRSPSRTRKSRRSILFPVHRAMLLRSELFSTMFASPFREAQETPYLQVVPVDCSTDVLEVVLTFLYCEKADFPLDIAIEVLFAADLLFIEKLKTRAAQLISTLGNGAASVAESDNTRGGTDVEEVIDIYDVIRAGWDTRVQRLEEFGARYIAFRLERYIDEPEFLELVKDSAARVKDRQETDTIELIDDIRWYLSERYRLRMEDAGLDEMLDENEAVARAQALLLANPTELDAPDITSPIRLPAQKGDAPMEAVVRRTDRSDIDEDDDEMQRDTQAYEYFLSKIDALLDKLHLDA